MRICYSLLQAYAAVMSREKIQAKYSSSLCRVDTSSIGPSQLHSSDVVRGCGSISRTNPPVFQYQYAIVTYDPRLSRFLESHQPSTKTRK